MMNLFWFFMVVIEEPVRPPRESHFTSGILSSLAEKKNGDDNIHLNWL